MRDHDDLAIWKDVTSGVDSMTGWDISSKYASYSDAVPGNGT